MIIEKIDRELAQQRNAILSVRQLINSCTTVDAVTDIRAKTEAAKAWAKVHKQTKAIRLELLTVEIAALVKILELGGEDHLTRSELEAAKWFESLSESELQAQLIQHANITTAAGVFRKATNLQEEREAYRAETRHWAERFSTSSDDGSRLPDDTDYRSARQHVASIHTVLEDLLDEYVDAGHPFTVADVADEITLQASHGRGDFDPAIHEGLREVVRRAIGASKITTWAGLKIPQFITARMESSTSGDVEFIRVPVMNAQVRDVADMVDLREAQLAQDVAAVDVLKKFLANLQGQPGVVLGSNVGEVIQSSLTDSEKCPEGSARGETNS